MLAQRRLYNMIQCIALRVLKEVVAYSDGEGVNGFVIIDKKARLVAAFWQFAVFVHG